MKSATNNPVKIVTTGFIVLIFLNLSLFWIRFICNMNLIEIMSPGSKSVSVQPSGLLPLAIEKDPNVIIPSCVTAQMDTVNPRYLGINNYFMTQFSKRFSHILLGNSKENESIYFSNESGLIVCRYGFYQRRPDNTKFKKMVHFYAGPEGVSETPEQNLGRFEEVSYALTNLTIRENKPPEMIVYDKKIKRFFKIDFENATIVRGPDLKQDDFYNPIQTGQLSKNKSYITNLNWEPPYIDLHKRMKETTRESPISGYISYDHLEPLESCDSFSKYGPYMPVLDESGRIDLLDRESLEFLKSAGELPNPGTYFSSRRSPKVKPKDLLGYEVKPLFIKNPEDANSENSKPEYSGLLAASVSRNGTALALKVFDSNGKQIKEEHTQENISYNRGTRIRNTPSGRAVYFKAPWSSTLTTILYLTENLHPPILSIASIFTASSFEAGAGHRALFLLPNSFFAMLARDTKENFINRTSAALSLMIPAVLLAIILARRISRDGFVAGLTKKERIIWTLLTLAFGPAAYITYRLSKPKTAMVTCQNCGKPRRPDMEKCHRCKSGWHVPELTPPQWRVLGAEN